MNKKIVLITGASSGIGITTALLLLKNGYKVYGAARRTELMTPIKDAGGFSLFLDITDTASVEKCVSEIINREGKIDILINNAGYGEGGAVEDISIEKAKHQFDVNVFGLMNLTQKVLPYMRNNNYGKIINISSIGGKLSSPFLGWYHATKYSIEALSDALRMETKKWNIKVILIEPGLTNTNWGIIAKDSILKNSGETSYKTEANKAAKIYNDFYTSQKLASPLVISKLIIKAVKSKNAKARYKGASFARSLLFLKKYLPDSIYDFWCMKVFLGI